MTEFQATYYDGIHPVGELVTIQVTTDGNVSIFGENIKYSCSWSDIEINAQLGKTVRALMLPNGAKCESFAHEEINALPRNDRSSKYFQVLHLLESRWRYVILASLAVISFTWGMVVYGIPGLAKGVAHTLPISIDEKVSVEALKLLDDRFFKPSKLKEEEKQRLKKKFKIMVENTKDPHNFVLLFRWSFRANAFALPSGHIVITDKLIEKAEYDEEVLAVLAHEIGHVVHKHGLRKALQSSIAALFLTAITGDISMGSGFAAALPVLLLETSYSRKFEQEADQYAFEYMQLQGIDTIHFANILKKISGDESEEESILNYLSTHPVTTKRTQRFIQGSQTNNSN